MTRGIEMTDVKAIAGWAGWCDPCGTERPLVLTETGLRGVRAWLKGLSWEDRSMGLYCRVCGRHQVVPLHEEDDPVVAVVLPDLVTALTRLGASAVVLARPAVSQAAPTPAPAKAPARSVVVPAQRRAASPTSIALPDSETSLDLAAAGLAIA